MIKFFIRKGCHDPEELFGETRDRVMNIIAAGGEYPNPDALFYSVGNKVWHEDRRKIKPDPMDEDPPCSDPDDGSKELESYCLGQCLIKLPDVERELITRYYEGGGRNKIEARKYLAMEHGGENSLRIKTYRIRIRLRACMDGCMNQAGVN